MQEQSIANGGMQYVPQIAVQYVYLDFDGELTSYNGEILTIDNVEVIDSKLTAERIANIVAKLNDKYASQNVIFVTERPEGVEYSTILIGKTSAFDQYGTFAGLAETIDEGNQIKNDNAFVMLDSTAGDAQIISTISHETDHLLGTLNHGGEGLAAYASNLVIGYGVTSYGWDITYRGNSATVLNGGTIHHFSVYSSGSIKVCSGGSANNTSAYKVGHIHVSNGGIVTFTSLGFLGYTYVSSGGSAYGTEVREGSIYVSGGTAERTTIISSAGNAVVESGGTAIYTTVNRGTMTVSAGGVANHTVVDSTGRMYISRGGTANSTTVNSRGWMFIWSGGTANSTTVNSGDISIVNGGSANSTTVKTGGDMVIESGGIHCGSLQMESGAVVSAYEGSVIDFTISDRTASDGYLINNLSFIAGNPTYTITVAANQSAGTYKLAQGAENFKGSISIGNGTVSYGNLSVNGTALKYNNASYKLMLSNGNLNLSVDRAVVPVTDSPATDIKNRGFSQVIAWDKNRGTVGMIHNNGKFPAAWGGVWEWSGSDINLWRVAGAGHFKGSKVDYDGVLLYNGIGNTFAAWTDLNDPSYGYVDLCHVEGSFNTRAIADFDGNNYDDILIYDDKGSFGTVLDGTTYKDIWHVDNASSNPWKVLGAGSFGGAADKLIVENSSNGHLYLWQNNDSSFKTWNWSQIDIGYLGKDSKFMVSGDFSGDGTDDVVIQKSNGEMWCWDDGNSANLRWIGNLDSTFAVESVGDYNADGKEDILLREQSSGWGGLGFWGAGYAGNWTDMNVRIETDTRISGSKFAIIA